MLLTSSKQSFALVPRLLQGNFRFENFVFADLKVMDSSDIFDTASQEGEEEYEEELSAAEVSVCFILT